MTTTLLIRRFLAEYARKPINVALLVTVPILFVTLAAGALADFAKAVGTFDEARQLAAPTAAWAAAFLAGVAGFFHVHGSRGADRRLSSAGIGPAGIVTSRVVSGLVLCLLAAFAALGALALRTGIDDPVRAAAGAAMAGVIYLAIGAAVGAIARTEVNGSLVVVFIWMIDVFFGPAMAGGGVWITRLFPTHYVTLVTLDAASGHAGPIGDLGWSVAWTLGALLGSALVFRAATGRAGIGLSRPSVSARMRRLGAGLRYGLRDYRRNAAMWVLITTLPILFISLSFAVTPATPTPVELVENGNTSTRIISMLDLHGAIMVPITVGFLAGLAGLFVLQGSLHADRRLALTGFRSGEILAARLGVITIAAVAATAVALAVTGLDFSPQSWLWFTSANLIVAVTYAMIGVLVGAAVGRLGGLYLMFLIPFIDIGIAQNAMFSVALPGWGVFLPGRGASRVLLDAAFTATFDELGHLLLALAWMAALAIAATAVFRRLAEPKSV